jgi:hypothetical protein
LTVLAEWTKSFVAISFAAGSIHPAPSFIACCFATPLFFWALFCAPTGNPEPQKARPWWLWLPDFQACRPPDVSFH